MLLLTNMPATGGGENEKRVEAQTSDYIRCLYRRNFYCRGRPRNCYSDSRKLVVAAPPGITTAFLWKPRLDRFSTTMGSSQSDGKLATGKAVNEQVNIPKVASSLWLVKLPVLLNVIGASPVAS
jgi:hypothetical protein